MTPDTINGLYEMLGCVFISLSIRKLYQDKTVAGYHWGSLAFFTTWGYWNMYYYPLLNQWWSTIGAIATALTNTLYLAMMIYYGRKA